MGIVEEIFGSWKNMLGIGLVVGLLTPILVPAVTIAILGALAFEWILLPLLVVYLYLDKDFKKWLASKFKK